MSLAGDRGRYPAGSAGRFPKRFASCRELNSLRHGQQSGMRAKWECCSEFRAEAVPRNGGTRVPPEHTCRAPLRERGRVNIVALQLLQAEMI